MNLLINISVILVCLLISAGLISSDPETTTEPPPTTNNPLMDDVGASGGSPAPEVGVGLRGAVAAAGKNWQTVGDDTGDGAENAGDGGDGDDGPDPPVVGVGLGAPGIKAPDDETEQSLSLLNEIAACHKTLYTRVKIVMKNNSLIYDLLWEKRQWNIFNKMWNTYFNTKGGEHCSLFHRHKGSTLDKVLRAFLIMRYEAKISAWYLKELAKKRKGDPDLQLQQKRDQCDQLKRELGDMSKFEKLSQSRLGKRMGGYRRFLEKKKPLTNTTEPAVGLPGLADPQTNVLRHGEQDHKHGHGHQEHAHGHGHGHRHSKEKHKQKEKQSHHKKR
jgi:hypothetical protein